jgi:septum formation protein
MKQVPAAATKRLILASASPRRRWLLRRHGWQVTVQPAGIDEVAPAHLAPGEMAMLNALRKARAVAARHPGVLVLAADTVVVLGTRVMGKPRDLREARRMLRALAGRTHHVFTGVWIEHRARGIARGFVEVSHVSFRQLSSVEIERYVLLVDPLDKAGGYAAQEDPMQIIQAIAGSRSNVIGLPMERLEAALAGLG